MNDILADLAGMQKQRGNPCVRVRIQRDHPELLEQFDKGVNAHEFSNQTVADWLNDRVPFVISEEMVRKHRVNRCQTCRMTS